MINHLIVFLGQDFGHGLWLSISHWAEIKVLAKDAGISEFLRGGFTFKLIQMTIGKS